MATIGIVKTNNGDFLEPTYRVTRDRDATLREVDYITAEILRDVQSLYAATQIKLKELYDESN
jgi:hypothetical protein